MLAPPLLLTLDLTRVEHAEDPYAFRFQPQDYLARTEGGAVSRIHLEWDQAWLDDLDRVRRPSPAPSTLQRVGARLSEFLAGAEWTAQAAAIEGVVRAGRSAILTIRSTAAELYALPWELLFLGASGQHLGELDGVVIRYEWPDTSTVPEVPAPRSERGRVLLAWSAAGGRVPASEHLDVIAAALERAHRPFDRERDVLTHASLETLEATLEAAFTEGPPIDVLHLLAHAKGGFDGGLVLDGADGGAARVSPEKLRQLLGRHAGMIRLVVFSACESADPGDVAKAHGGLTQVLHRAGIAAVIGSRFPLAVEASLRFSRALYEGLLLSLSSLEESVARARAELRQRTETADWATLQLYARTSDGADSRPLVIRPYRGLLPYGPENRRLFFGRTREVQELRRDLQRLSESGRPRMMIVAGASGSGKSSVVLAGLVPSLLEDASERWSWTLMRPGAAPMNALASAIGKVRGTAVTAAPAPIIRALAGWRDDHPQGRLLLVVDQLEEIFTQGADEAERTTFARLLWAIAGGSSSPVTLVSTLRVDFIGACGQVQLDEEGLRLDRIAYDERHRTFVARADRRLLRTVIETPARTVGLTLEPGLVERLIDDIDGDAGALPAISHALDLLWHRRRRHSLTQEGYDAIGGVKGALAIYAERIVDDLDEESLLQARRLFVRLVGDGDGLGGANQDTRTRLPRDRLRPFGAGGEAFDRMLESLTEQRLLVLSEGLLDRGPSAPTGVAVEDIAWDSEGRLLVLQSDGLLLEFRMDSQGWLGERRILRHLELGAPATLAVSNEGGRHQVALNEPEDHRARIVDLEGDASVVIDGGEAPFTTIVLIDRGRSLLTASGDPSVTEIGERDLRIWDTRSGDLRSTFPLDRGLAIAVASAPKRDALLALTREGELLTWDRQAPGSAPVRADSGYGPLVAAALDPAAERALLSTAEGQVLIHPWETGPALRLHGADAQAATLLAWQGSERVLAVDRGGLRSYGAEAKVHEPRQMSEAAIRSRVYEIASCMPFSELEALAARYGVRGLSPRTLCADNRAAWVGEVQVGDVLLVLLLPILFVLEVGLVLLVRWRRREDPSEPVEAKPTPSPAPSGDQSPPSPVVGLVGAGVVLLLAMGLAFSAINVLKGDAGSSTISLTFVTAWVFTTASRLSPGRIRPASVLVRRLLTVARALMFVVAAVLAILIVLLYWAPPELKADRTSASALFTFGLLLLTLLLTFAVGLRQTSQWLIASPQEGSQEGSQEDSQEAS